MWLSILYSLSLLYTFLYNQYVLVECEEFVVMNLIIFVLSKYRIELLVTKYLIIWDRTKFDTEKKSSKFLLEIITLVSSANNIGSDTEFVFRESHLRILWTTETLELILEELNVAVNLRQGNKFELH